MLRKIKSNKASSALISFILIVPLFLGIVVTIFDTTMYFSNRSAVLASAQEGARYAAIIGGPGDSRRQTSIEREYGSENNCGDVVPESSSDGNNYFDATTRTPTECVVLKSLYNSSLTLTAIEDISCYAVTPGGSTTNFTTSIGDTVFCEVSYTYYGLPGAPLHWIQNGEGNGLMESVKVSATANAEVGGAALVLRG